MQQRHQHQHTSVNNYNSSEVKEYLQRGYQNALKEGTVYKSELGGWTTTNPKSVVSSSKTNAILNDMYKASVKQPQQNASNGSSRRNKR